MSDYESVLPSKHFISSDPFILCSQSVNSSYSGIASFTKKQTSTLLGEGEEEV